jgi:hypothetical protein
LSSSEQIPFTWIALKMSSIFVFAIPSGARHSISVRASPVAPLPTLITETITIFFTAAVPGEALGSDEISVFG